MRSRRDSRSEMVDRLVLSKVPSMTPCTWALRLGWRAADVVDGAAARVSQWRAWMLQDGRGGGTATRPSNTPQAAAGTHAMPLETSTAAGGNTAGPLRVDWSAN